MAPYREVMGVDELEEGQMRCLVIDGQELLVARGGGTFYVADNKCPHMGSKLAQGKLEGTVVTCPGHGSQFDLKDGSIVRWTDWSGLKLGLSKVLKAPTPLVTYPVKVEAGRVLAEL
ncbi:MAG: Rieske (2Fe-2S) protein [Chloroflexota bacterium]